MRSIFLIAYDVHEDKRRTQLYKKLRGYGEALQFSLFQCKLTPNERAKLRTELWDLIDHATDRILIINLGPEDGRGSQALESFGHPLVDPANHAGILII